MKALKLIVVGIMLFLSYAVQAQVSVNVNIGSPPPWGPVGYTEVRYYYLPDVEAYYDVQTSMFIYYGGGVWVHRAYLPARYRSYDLYNGYKVVMTDYRGETPYVHFREYKTKYARGYHGEKQRTIGERPAKENAKAKMAPRGQSNGRMATKDHSGERMIKSDNKSAGHGNDKGYSPGKEKNNNGKQDHGHENGKKK